MTEQPEAITALAEQLTSDSLALWTDDKRKDFVKTFDARIRASQYILLTTAQNVIQKAKDKHFLSDKHTLGKLYARIDTESLYDHNQDVASRDPNTFYVNRVTYYSIGGRTLGDLQKIAKERADAIIEQLPSLTDAVRIISPDVSKKIEERQKLFDQGKALLEKTKPLSGPVEMADMDQKMSIGEFRAMIKNREKKRLLLLNEMDEIGKEGLILQNAIDKFLYEGLPGLSEAVIKVVTDFQERATAMSAFNRRVGEQVMFGDSEAALQMLKSFEKDEIKISDDIKSSFDEALKKLKLAGKELGVKPGKKLKAGKR